MQKIDIKVFHSFPVFLDFFNLFEILCPELRVEGGGLGYMRENYTLYLYGFFNQFLYQK